MDSKKNMKRKIKLLSVFVVFDPNVVTLISKETVNYQFRVAKKDFIRELKKKGYYKND